MEDGSPISIDFGSPLPVDIDSGYSIQEQNPQHDHASSSNLQRETAEGNPARGRASVDSGLDKDLADRWSASPDERHVQSEGVQSAYSTAHQGSGKQKQADDGKLPAWSELKTKAGKERKRLPLACIDCRRKKIKCSGEKPACQHCIKSRIPCVYKNAARKAAPRTDYMAMLDKRLKRMEDRVIRMIPKEDLPDLSSIGRSNVRPPIPGQPAKKEKPSGDKADPEEAFQSVLGDWSTKQAQKGAELGAHSRRVREFENKLSTEGATELPPIAIQEHLAELFFECVYGQSYLLLHKPSFMRKLKAGKIPPVLMLAICAISARFSTHPQVSTEPAFLRGERWATVARGIVEKRHFEPNITILTVMIILGLHFFGTCEGGLSWSFGGQAMRLGYALQLHREMDHDPLGRAQAEREASDGKMTAKLPELSFTDREIRRRLMWSCYLMDVFNSSGTERPAFLNEEYIKIQLPIKEAFFQQERPGLTEDIDGHVTVPDDLKHQAEQSRAEAKFNLGVAAFVIRAVVIWKRVVQYLNLGGKEKDPYAIWEPSSQFALLQKQIDRLKDSLPEELQYNSDTLAVHVSDRLANQFLFLHIILAQTRLFLHRFAIPIAPNVHRPYPANTPKPFLNTCARTVVESATLVSKILADSTGHTLTVPFAGYCAYTSATVHVWGIFSKHTGLEAASRRNLRHNYRYLMRMKRHWGMFHYMAESIKDIYRVFFQAANNVSVENKVENISLTAHKSTDQIPLGTTAIGELISEDPSRAPSPTRREGESTISMNENKDTKTEATVSNNQTPEATVKPILQYGDWFDRYPHGVSETEWESTHHPYKKDAANGNEGVMGQKSELQSIEEFFASLSLPSKAANTEKDRNADAVVSDSEASGRGKKIPRRRGKSVVENFQAGGVAGGLIKGHSRSGSKNLHSSDDINNNNTDVGTKPVSSAKVSFQAQRPRTKRVGSGSTTGSGTKIIPQGQAQRDSPRNASTHSAAATASKLRNTSDVSINTPDMSFPVSGFNSGTIDDTQQTVLQFQPDMMIDTEPSNSPSYFNTSTHFMSVLTPTTQRPSLEFDYNSPFAAPNPELDTNAQGSTPMNFNFGYASALPHLDRQVVFGAYADSYPSTINNQSTLNDGKNFNFWSDPWNSTNTGANIDNGNIDLDGLESFHDVGMGRSGGGGGGGIQSESFALFQRNLQERLGPVATNTGGSHQNQNQNQNQNSNVSNRFQDAVNKHDYNQYQQNDPTSGMGGSAWFMPFNIDPPIFSGFDGSNSFDAMDTSGNDIEDNTNV